MKEMLSIEPKRAAIVAIDMHRGHLDPSVATMPVPPEECRRVLVNAKRLFVVARKHKIPIIHVILKYREIPGLGTEAATNPFWTVIEKAKETLTPGRPSTVMRHNVEGSIQTEIMPEIAPQTGDYVISSKRRLSAFYGTDLDLLLRALKVDTTILIGINTNTCVLCTAFEAFNRDLKVIVVSDCVASMYGDDLHVFGLQNLSRCLGWVLDVTEFEGKLREHKPLVAA
jgi:nicotinamidase-related amidase